MPSSEVPSPDRLATSLRRLVGVVFATGFVASLSASPISAGTSTHHVGKGGGAGACATPDFATLGAAVAAALPGDTVLVCPGTYKERVDVATPDLTIRGVSPWTAVLKPKGSVASPLVRLTDTADGTTVQWLKVVARTSGTGCIPHDGIRVESVDAVIRSNRVVADTTGDTQHGPCTLQNGIHIAPGASATVATNLVRAFSVQGIWAQSALPTTITRNSVRFWHTSCVTADICAAAGPATAPLITGINIFNTAATVGGNAVSSSPGAVGANVIPFGIRANSTAPVTFRNNIVLLAQVAIALDPGAAGSVVSGNTATGGGVGIRLFGTSGAKVRNNILTSFTTIGIWVGGTTGNLIKGNDASAAGATVDCQDSAAPGANTWRKNLGVTSSPVGLCAAP